MLTLTGCENKPAAGVFTPQAPSAPAAQGGEQNALPPGVTTGRTEPSSGNSSPEAPAVRKGTLVFTGGLSVLGSGLYTVSTLAREAVPTRFSGYDLEYSQPQPLAKAGRILAIARRSYGSAGDSLHLLNLDTGQSYPVYVTKGQILSFSIAPDDVAVAVSERAEPSTGFARIRLIDLPTETAVDLPGNDSRGAYSDLEPRFSPDGKTLVFERQGKERSSILAVSFPSRQAEKPVELVAVPRASQADKVSSFRFSPDGGSYAYLRQTGRASRLVVRAAGQPELTVDAAGNAYEPVWSPDGKSLLFWTDSPDAQTLQLFVIGSKSPVALTTFTIARGRDEVPVCPAWAADMSEIYFTGRTGSWTSIFKLSLGKRSVTRLTDPLLPTSYYCARVIENYEERL